MRIYEGSHRQDWEEVLRSLGSYLDERGMHDIVFVEMDHGFFVQGLLVQSATGSAYSESMGSSRRETLELADDQVAAFLDAAIGRRGQAAENAANRYEQELRVIGRHLDEAKPRDVFFFEIDGAYVMRLATVGQGGFRYELLEFTREDIAKLIASAPNLRRAQTPTGT
jgi:hypothetical protein